MYIYRHIHIWKHIFKYYILKRFWMLGLLCPFLRLRREYNKAAITQIVETKTRTVKSGVLSFSPINKKTSRVKDGCMTSFRSNYCQNYAFWEGWQVALAFSILSVGTYSGYRKIEFFWAYLWQHRLMNCYLQKWITKTSCVCQNYFCDLNVKRLFCFSSSTVYRESVQKVPL